MRLFHSFKQSYVLAKPAHDDDRDVGRDEFEGRVQLSIVVASSDRIMSHYSMGDKIIYPAFERILTKINGESYHLVQKNFIFGKVLSDDSLFLRERYVAVLPEWEPSRDDCRVNGFPDEYCGFGYVASASDDLSSVLEIGDAVFYSLDFAHVLKINGKVFKIFDFENVIAKI